LLQVFKTADERWLQGAAVGQPGFEGLMRAIGRTELIAEPAYLTNDDREGSRGPLQKEVAAWIAEHSLEQCIATFDADRVPCSPVQDIAQLRSHPHVKARGSFTTLEDKVYGPLPVVAPIPRLDRTPGSIRTPAPALGEHTAEILGELLGISAAELADLAAIGVVGNR
jgi:crotonobetainyl-CoA:carnitine CoA-transferase CaiB-like acyl-CoA transferase